MENSSPTQTWSSPQVFLFRIVDFNCFICLNPSDVGQHGAPLSLHVSLGPGLAHSLGVPGHGGQPRCQGGHRDKPESWVQIPMKIISYLLESGDVYLNWAIIGIT